MLENNNSNHSEKENLNQIIKSDEIDVVKGYDDYSLLLSIKKESNLLTYDNNNNLIFLTNSSTDIKINAVKLDNKYDSPAVYIVNQSICEENIEQKNNNLKNLTEFLMEIGNKVNAKVNFKAIKIYITSVKKDISFNEASLELSEEDKKSDLTSIDNMLNHKTK